jgi:hypothetical protein
MLLSGIRDGPTGRLHLLFNIPAMYIYENPAGNSGGVVFFTV